MRAALLFILVGAASIGGYYGYQAFSAGPQRLPYKITECDRGDVRSTAMATGTVEPLVKVLVGSQVSGTVMQWFADFNQAVSKDEILANLDQDQITATIEQRRAALAVAQARVEEAAARLAAVSLDRQRLEDAYASNSASDFEVNATRAAEREAAAAVRAAEAQVQVAAAELRAAQIQLDKTVIRSPIDGVVISRDIDAGQTVAASLSAPTLFTIANDLARMRVNAAVSETDIGKVREGMQVEFRVDAYPGRTFQGQVSQVRFAETVVDNVVTYETLIDVDNPDLLLRPGMTATIVFEVDKNEDILRVPNSALRFEPRRDDQQVSGWGKPGSGQPRQPRVYKLVGSEIQEVPVDLGITDGTYTAIRSGELAVGDKVVVGWDLTAVPRQRRLF